MTGSDGSGVNSVGVGGIGAGPGYLNEGIVVR